ncbi:MAG: alkaline phosphatase [Phycisphaeraceae bacterium]|nr:alkaline phosphatase [Phycisphaeraceae bacterium]
MMRKRNHRPSGSTPFPLSRRQWLGATAAAAGAAVLPWSSVRGEAMASVPATQPDRAATVHNVIFMVSDGMSMGVLSLAEMRRQMDGGSPTHWGQMLRDAGTEQGMYDTSSANSLVTDSAAAASAWASGRRVNNATLNILPSGEKRTPIGRLVRQSGRRLGLVSTTTITHATPAGFAAMVTHRDQEPTIAAQYLDEVGVDVLLGGGSKFFRPEGRDDRRDLLGDYRKAGYAVVQSAGELDAWRPGSGGSGGSGGSEGGKLLGLFADSHVPFELDRRADVDVRTAVPTLARMTQRAIDALATGPKGFFLLVEGGRVDHAAHNNDAAAIIEEQLAFDDAIGVALAFARDRDDTLVVVTTDHGNSNPGLLGMGAEYLDSTNLFRQLRQVRRSFEWITQQIAARGNHANTITQIVAQATGMSLREPEAAALAASLNSQPVPELQQQHRTFVGLLGQMIANRTGVAFNGTAHTSDWAPLSAIGPRQEQFAGVHRNVDVFTCLTTILALPVRA